MMIPNLATYNENISNKKRGRIEVRRPKPPKKSYKWVKNQSLPTERVSPMHGPKQDFKDEMKCFVSILLVSGYNVVPRKSKYWGKSEDTHNYLIANAISRDRFQYVMSNIHVCQNDKLDSNDRFSKVRPLLDLIGKRCRDSW